MHMDKQITQSILVILCSMRDTEIAKVEGLPQALVVLSFYSSLPQ